MFILIKADGMTGVWYINKAMKLHNSETVIKKSKGNSQYFGRLEPTWKDNIKS